MTVDVLLANSRQKVRCHIAKSNDSQEISVGDGLIQAYVFVFLTSLYIQDAVE